MFAYQIIHTKLLLQINCHKISTDSVWLLRWYYIDQENVECTNSVNVHVLIINIEYCKEKCERVF